MKSNPLFLLVISLFIGFFSCNDQPSNELRQSLELAGDNENQLITVLEYFKKKDRKQYKAACFLIENMQYHQSEKIITLNDSIHSFFQETDSLFNTLFGGLTDEEIANFNPKPYDSLRQARAAVYSNLPSPVIRHNAESDIKRIQASFLIEHIETAFHDWKNNPLSKKLSFDEFKEFLLPYRATNEALIISRRQLRELYGKRVIKDSTSNLNAAIANFKTYVAQSRWINKNIKDQTNSGWYDLFLPKFDMDCHNMTNWSSHVMRANGIPVVYEYTPQWIDRDHRHFWSVSPDSTGIYQPYTLPDNNIREDYETYIKYAGKVYRRGFAANKQSPYFLANEYEYIPKEFQSPILSDQTFRYHQTVTLRLPHTGTTENNLVYLCMLNGERLNPVGWGILDREKQQAVLEQIPLNVIFHLAYFEDETLTPLGHPFMVASTEEIDYISTPLTVNKPSRMVDLTWNGEHFHFSRSKRKEPHGLKYVEIAPIDTLTERMLLLRKYPEKRAMKILQENQVGGVLIARSRKGQPYDTLLTITSAPIPNIQELTIENPGVYGEYRFTCSGRPVNVAHIEFLGPYDPSQDCSEPTPLPIFHPELRDSSDKRSLYRINGEIQPTSKVAPNAFDNNFDTYVASSSVAMSFSPPVLITHVRFAPRNANNMIVVGDLYRLSYYDNGWKAHETQRAEYNYLLFENVPAGTIYMLKNLDHGDEELPFFYVDDKQRFVNISKPFVRIP